MADQLPLEPLTPERRASLSDSLVAMLLARRQVAREKKESASGYSEQLKDLDRDIYELTKVLNVPVPMPGPGPTAKHPDDREGYADRALAVMDLETVEVTGDDLPDGDDEIDSGTGPWI